MKKKYKRLLLTFLFIGLIGVVAFLAQWEDIAVLNPKGIVGVKEKKLLITASWLMLIIVIPVLILAFVIPWRYRKNNAKAKYDPDWDYSFLAEALWWGVPFVIIVILSVLVWRSSHELDPFKPLESENKPLKIQTVALQWRWLFIYPELGIATINYIQFPEQTPLHFEITADAPMNSFWIPKLGSQIYAMPGMNSQLYLMADDMGSFRGSSANLSGKGFSKMNFVAKASSSQDFDQWVDAVKQSSNQLNRQVYDQLVQPSENTQEMFYVLEEDDLYDQIIMKYKMSM